MEQKLKKSYDLGYHEGAKAASLGWIIGLLIITMLVIVTVMAIFWGDSTDSVNTRALGKILCKENELAYGYRTWLNNSVPVIHCLPAQQEVIDGVVVKNMRWEP